VQSYETKISSEAAETGFSLGLRPVHDLREISELVTKQTDLETREEFQFLACGRNKQALLIVLQGLNSSLKEEVIRHVLMSISPQGQRVVKINPRTAQELAQDFCRRPDPEAETQFETPLFNRSHDEDVVVIEKGALKFEEMHVTEAAFLGASDYPLGLNDFLKLDLFRWIRTMNKTENIKMDTEFTGPFPRYSGAISAVTEGSPEDINEMPACLNTTEECTIYGDSIMDVSKLEVLLIRGS
jgi:hypothetical protein